MEGLEDNGHMDVNKPEATFKSGSINKIIDFNNVFSSPERNRSIIHDIPTVGGASGSPVFLKNGHVVAIIWGASHTGQKNNGERIANATQHNFAVRIDSLQEVLSQKAIPIEEWTGN